MDLTEGCITLYPWMPWRLLGDKSAPYQIPFFVSIKGHMIPHERTAPISKDIFTMYGQIIPTPTYVIEKSK